jgi:SAM-dependent methyltransferase
MTQHSKYQNKNPIHQFFLQRFLSHIPKVVKETGARTILDAASAQGYVMGYLHERIPDLTFTGVDLDREALEEARMLHPYAEFFEGDITTYTHLRPVDLVLALEVFEHIPEPERAFKNLARVDSKFFLFSVPHEPWFRIMNFLRGRHWRRLGNHPEHINLWSKRRFKRDLGPYFKIIGDYSSFPWIIYLCRHRQ